jgi:hypothetical protein
MKEVMDTCMPALGEIKTALVSVEIGEPIGFGYGALHAPEQTHGQLVELAEEIKRYLVPVDKSAPGVCMDGRGCEITVGGTPPVVGPQCAGGSLQTGFAAAELVAGYYGDRSAPDATGRALEVGALLTAKGINIGGHTTVGAVKYGFRNPDTGAEATGCGGEEKHPASTERIVKKDSNVMAAAQMLSGVNMSVNYVDHDTMKGRNASYSAKAMHDIETAQNEGKNQEILVDIHDEGAVVWNTVKGMTLDRDAFVKATGKKVFFIDAWYIDDIVKALAAGRPDAVEMYPALLQAATAFQIATYAELCDGSHPLLTITDGSV